MATVSDGWKGYVGDTLREKLGRSPDRADAVVYLYRAVLESSSTMVNNIDASAFEVNQQWLKAVEESIAHYAQEFAKVLPRGRGLAPLGWR